MRQRRKRSTSVLSLLLAFSMLFSMTILPASAKEPAYPEDLDAIVALLSSENGVDGESAFDYLGTVFLGWRTTGGPWQNYVINDFIGEVITNAGYKDMTDSYTGDGFFDWTHDYSSGDQFWVQHDESSSLAWAPEYARMEITSIKKDGQEVTEGDIYDLKQVVDVESFSYDPTSDIYQAHYIDKYDLNATVGDDDGFIRAMSDWINQKDGSGNRTMVFPEGEEPGAARGEEAHLNERAHLATNTSFNVTAEELAAIRENPGNVSELAAGQTGEVVYVGNVSSYEGDKAALAGKVLLCDSSNSRNFTFAQEVGAISVMTTASLDNYSNPIEEENWFGPEGIMNNWYDTWYGGENEWYTNSARFAGGAGSAKNQAAMEAGKPIVEWNISPDQYNALRTMLDEGYTVEMNVASVGEMYGMSDPEIPAAQGQLTAIAEIKGSDPVLQKERIVLAAHVQEPGCDDNATGVALNLELAVKMKKLIDAGVIPRPQRTIVFMWGDEMSFSSLYLNAHEEDIENIICCIDLDMVGEDPAKTGGPMRIEKAPDPAAYYNYTLDNIPEDPLYYDGTRSDSEGNFVRLPDSHTLWGAGDPASVDLGGIFINDLYMASAQSTRTAVKDTLSYDFEVDVCPYEGGSDHTKFLQRGVPAVLTWHFTDYVYHTTVDTLYMASADEMESVGITSLAAGYFAANPTQYADDMMQILVDAADDRFASEAEYNTAAHKEWADTTGSDVDAAYAQEVEVLSAWGDWYREAIESCGNYFAVDSAKFAPYLAQIDAIEQKALLNAHTSFYDSPMFTVDDDLLCLDMSTETFNATLTTAVSDEQSGWTQDQWEAWADSITLSLTRDKVDVQNPALYPNIYTGDDLENWMSWGTNGNHGSDGVPYFTLEDPVVTVADGYATVKLTFSHGIFFNMNDPKLPLVTNSLQAIGSNTFRYARNVWPSFIGNYELSAKIGDTVLATTPMEINVYESNVRQDELYDELMEIKALAEANGRYFDVQSFGKSTDGYDQWYAVVSDSAESVANFKEMNALAQTDPEAVLAQIEAGKDYRIPIMMNNVHSDEAGGVDAHTNLLRTLATEDTIKWNTITGLVDGEVDMSQYDPKIVDFAITSDDGETDYGFTGYGLKISATDINSNGNDGRTDASAYYTFSEDKELKVGEILDNLIIIVTPDENPDGRTYNTRPNGNGFDLNRDASNQTQVETQNIAKLISEWNPVAFVEFHGFTAQFLVEPCTPPHEPNLEYDLFVEQFLLGAEAYGNAALATMSVQHKDEFETKYQTYYTPLRDSFDAETGWDAWDDLSTNYTPSYAMLNCGSMGFTIETPSGGESSVRLLESGAYGLWQFLSDCKDTCYKAQLEFFRRGINNEDHRAEMESWYVDMSNQQLPSDTWRVPYEGNDKYFPEYYVLPVDAASQRDPADAYEMAEFLMRNGVKVSTLTKDTTVDGVTYKAGSLVVNMYQAKRNYANCLLNLGNDASASGFPSLYSESVSSFPSMRGFDCIAIDTIGAFDGALKELTEVNASSQVTGSGSIVILANNGDETVRAVNALLDAGKKVGMITEGDYKGDFVLSYNDYASIASSYTLVVTRTNTMPVAYEISKPTLFLTGRYANFGDDKVTSGYYTEWFADGYGFINYDNIHNNGTSNYDVMAYVKQMGFTVVDDPAEADIIIGSVALNSGAWGDQAVAAVKAGTPYIATGSSTLSYIKNNLITGLDYKTNGQEALHNVVYPSDSLITASQAADGDTVIYSLNCAVLTSYPENAQVLIKATDQDSFIVGCMAGGNIDGGVEAIALEQDGMDITIFANSIVNRAHQQDDYLFATNTIYSKMLSDEQMEISTSSGGSSGGSTSYAITVEDSDIGTVTSSRKSASKGTTVTLTVKPDEGYKLDKLTVTQKNGDDVKLTDKGNGTYTFSMPSAAVTVEASFIKDDAPVETSLPFTDVKTGDWFYEAVKYAYDQKLMDGTSSTTFAPLMTTNRAMVVTILWRQAGSPVVNYAMNFDDVESGVWYTEAVRWAASENIVKGYSDTAFAPNDTVTREQLAVILYRYAQYKGYDVTAKGALTGFSDGAKTSSWATEAMEWAVGSKLLSGKGGNVLDPTGTATRAEVAQIFMNFVQNLKK